MHCFVRQSGMMYRWPRRKWTANALASTRSSSRKAVSARQYNNQTTDRVTAYDTPFANIILPISRNGTGSKTPVPRPFASERDRRLREIGNKSVETRNDESGVHLRDANNDERNLPQTIHDATAGRPENNRNKKTNDLRYHYMGENDVRDELLPISADDVQNLESELPPSDRDDSYRRLIDANEDQSDALPSQEELWLVDTLRHIDEQALEKHPETTASRTIHIIGTNAVGKLLAHSLAGLPDAPSVTLMVHHPRLVKQWYDEGCSIKQVIGRQVDERSGIAIELTRPFYDGRPGLMSSRNLTHRPLDTIIDHLVVTTEGRSTIAVLASIQHRIKPSSTICFLQDSLAIIKYVNLLIFPDLAQRPNYIMGSVGHKVYGIEDNYNFVEHRKGVVSLTPIPRETQLPRSKDEGVVVARRMDQERQPTTTYLMRTFSRTSNLHMTRCRVQEFYKSQFENMAITAAIGPVAVVHECLNAQLFQTREATLTIRQLLQEISSIIRAFPEVSRYPALAEGFGARRLKTLAYSALTKSGRNRAPMLQNVMNGKDTNIDFSTGYFLRRGRELGINCPRLDMITTMVKGKESIRKLEMDGDIPFPWHQS